MANTSENHAILAFDPGPQLPKHDSWENEVSTAQAAATTIFSAADPTIF